MKQEIEVDRNLYHLQDVLFDLDNYSFDSDIIKLLNELKFVLDKKMFSNIAIDGGYWDKKIKVVLNLH